MPFNLDGSQRPFVLWQIALVREGGAIMLGDKVGSIHRIGAVAQGSGACNGWTFWHIETKKGLRLIDELRAEIRSGMAVG